MEKFEAKNLDQPEEVRLFEKGKLELVTVAGKTIGRVTFQPGWRWSTCVKPIAKTKSCEAAHYGYQLSGTITTRLDDGTERTTRAGDVINIPAGHDGWVEGNETVVVVDFQGMLDYAKKK
ncbi:MAG: cupin [Elusimicrobia bacterium GWA2_69_24]|nr:MAG: cupin [Elusimicrobia bacterium GWA2_69_24]HBL18470.1 cupin [Elusimicrobiota bacterium]